METLTGCYVITSQDIMSGSATIDTGHRSVGGEATCQTTKPLSRLHAKAPKLKDKPNLNRPVLRVLSPVTVASGDLVVPVKGLNKGERIRWLSWGT